MFTCSQRAHVIPVKSADELSAFCPHCRRRATWKAGTRKRIKRRYNQRQRRELKSWVSI